MSSRHTDSGNGIKYRDPDMIGAEAAMKRAALRARERAKQAGHGIAIWQNGQVVELHEAEVREDDTPPYNK